jgi:hypothetical protein
MFPPASLALLSIDADQFPDKQDRSPKQLTACELYDTQMKAPLGSRLVLAETSGFSGADMSPALCVRRLLGQAKDFLGKALFSFSVFSVDT